MESHGFAFPDPEFNGEGTVVSTDKPKRSPEERHAYHKQLFMDRGISDEEAQRLADAVLARDAVIEHPPLMLKEELSHGS